MNSKRSIAMSVTAGLKRMRAFTSATICGATKNANPAAINGSKARSVRRIP